MTPDTVTRRLSAILAADVVGYSRLMEIDEVGTLAALKALRMGIVQPLVARYQGRIFKIAGDAVLIEFASPVNAVQCAIDLQERLAGSRQTPGDRQISLRIGINLGDVMVDGTDLYGDGVNIAARLEGLAEPGGVLVSEAVHSHVANKVSARFTDRGPQQLKNIATAIRVYRVEQVDQPKTSAATGGKAGEPSRSEKVAIAVLPFDNMSGDPEQGYFSDGITEDIITELSRFRELLVIARNSSFQFRGKAIDVKDVGRKLGADFVVEGSVRKIGNRVRVTVQLIDAVSTAHIWAERYDRDIADIFAVQDEVVRAICGVIPGQINRFAVESIRRKAPSNLTAYDCELRGRWALAHWNEGIAVAQDWYRKAIAADSDYALAHAGIAMTYAYGLYVLGLPPETALASAKQHAQRAVTLDDRNPTVNASAAFTYHVSCEPRLALVHAERAVSLNPNDPFVLYVQACALTYGGQPREALDWYARAAQLDPYTPDDQRLDTLCDCHYLLGDYDKAIEIFERYENIPAFLYLPMSAHYAQSGSMEKARAAVEQYELKRPREHDAATMIKYQARMCALSEDSARWLEGYRKAGFKV